ncbi:MAG TPA: TolC family protein [Syntrophales bacterium]|mgnify:CR=1 FL=1|nr:TolC family protein [Syntrophales bacterium]
MEARQVMGIVQRRIVRMLFFFLVLVTPVSAEEPVLKLTLKESIELARRQSVVIHSATEGIAAAESGRKAARADFLPVFNTSYDYTRLNKEPEMEILGHKYVTGTRDNYTWSMSVTQPVFAGGKILRNYEISDLAAQIARTDEDTTVQNIDQEVKEAYFDILKAERMLAVALQSVEQLKNHRDTAQSFYDVGIIPKNDLLYAEVQLASGQRNLVKAENGVAVAKARFNTVLRRPVTASVEVEDILTYRPMGGSLEECLQTALERRPEIRSTNLGIRQAEKGVALARGDYYPSVSLVGNYARAGDTPSVSGSLYEEKDSWYVAAVASWNFWEWGRTRYNVDVRKSRLVQAQDGMVNLTDLISLDVKNAYLYVREAEKQIFVAEKAIEQAEENFRINRERYKEQVATSTDVIDAETLLTQTKSDYSNALSDYSIAIARLERSMGIVYPDSIFTFVTGKGGN